MHKSTAKKLIALVFFFALSNAFRFQRIHTPFWVDEFSTANQALLLQRYGWQFFSQPNHYAEPRSIVTTLLVALAFTLHGVSEESARLPIAIFGALIPFLVYYLAKILIPTRKSVWFSAGLLSVTSYFLITWSRQARGYALQEFFLLTTVISYFFFLNHTNQKHKMSWFFASLGSILLGLFTHPTFFLVPVCLVLHFALLYRAQLFKLLHNKIVLGIVVVTLGFFTLFIARIGLLEQIVHHLQSLLQHGISNNIWYYHSFLWREYGLITFLGVIGLISLGMKNFKKMSLIGLLCCSYLFFVCFLFPAYDSRYLLPIFPFLLLGMAVSIDLLMVAVLGQLAFIKKKPAVLTGCTIFCTLIIIINGHKFDLKPSSFYSVNHDFREIALIDYDQVYGVIKQKGNLTGGQTAVIDTWPDRLEWYLGLDFHPNYVFRWEDEGYMKQTPFTLDASGDKVLKQRSQTRLISNLQDLQKVMARYPKGFIWIDDSSLPADVIEYAKKIFKQEIYLDHYPLDDNPYSIWPGTLYSWGL